MLFVSVASLVGCIYTMLLNAITLPFLAILILRNYKDEKALSPHFVVNLCTYLLGIFMCTPYTSYVLFWWRGDKSEYEMIIMFWTGTVFYAHSASLSTSIFFLVWDRCFSLISPVFYNRKRRHQFCMLNIAMQIFAYIVIVVWEMGSMPESNLYGNCMSYGCSSPTTAYKITYLKVFFATLNASSAGIFLFAFCRYNRLRSKKHGGINANYLAAFTLFMELLFSCLPNGISYAVWLIDEILLSPMLGPYLAYVFATEVFVVTCVYSRVIGFRHKRIQILKKSTTFFVMAQKSPSLKPKFITY